MAQVPPFPGITNSTDESSRLREALREAVDELTILSQHIATLGPSGDFGAYMLSGMRDELNEKIKRFRRLTNE